MENKPHILCVDDDDKIRELLKVFLKKNDFTVSTARNVDEAIEKIKFFIFDVIVLDIMMPKSSGIDFLTLFRNKNINTPIIMLTANNQLDIKTKSYTLGCDDYLSKPFEPTELVLRIKKLLNPRVNNLSKQKKSILETLRMRKIQNNSKEIIII